ncbi:MAG: YfiR family protein [Deltaproteobacteria bacterium]|nr:YfiR family protein [Deltaproteobacteria bacterium]
MTCPYLRQGFVIALITGLFLTTSAGNRMNRWDELGSRSLGYDATSEGFYPLTDAEAAASPEGGKDGPGDRVTAHDVKAALLYHFVKFVTWPPEVISGETTSICVFGENRVLASLQRSVEGKKIGGRSLIVKSFTSLEEIEFCHLLFIAAEEEDRMAQVLTKVRGWSTLSVNESEQFIRMGGMINFAVSGNKVRFQINEGAIRRAKLEIAPSLLRLAQ